jgi:hypothetical protein
MKTVFTAALLAISLAACGGGDEDHTRHIAAVAASPFENWPKCSDVWRVGDTLPAEFEGCLNDAGAAVPLFEWSCDDGMVLVYVDEPPAFARLGGEIKAGNRQTEAFSTALDACVPG